MKMAEMKLAPFIQMVRDNKPRLDAVKYLKQYSHDGVSLTLRQCMDICDYTMHALQHVSPDHHENDDLIVDIRINIRLKIFNFIDANKRERLCGSITNLSIMSHCKGFTIWHYDAPMNHTLEDIMRPRYFQNCSEMFGSHDVLYVYHDMGVTQLHCWGNEEGLLCLHKVT